jgi:multidrug efflux pump subunit AcrB
VDDLPVSAHRFYVTEPLAEGTVVTLPRDRSLQIAKVLRLRPGDREEQALRLGDVGTVERSPRPRARVRINGQPAAEIRARWYGAEARSALRSYCRRLRVPDGYTVECTVRDVPR